MPSLAQGYGRGMLLGLRLQEAQTAQERQRLMDERTGLLNEVTRESLAGMREDRKMRTKLLADLATKEQMTDELQTVKDFYGGPQILQQMLQAATTPPETKRRMRGLSETFPGMTTGYEPPRLTEEQAGKAQRIKAGLEPRAKVEGATATARNRAATYQRFKKWYIDNYGATPEEEIRRAFRKREFDEKAKGAKRAQVSSSELRRILKEGDVGPEEGKAIERELERREEKAIREYSPGYGLPAKTARQATPAEGIPGMEPFQPSGVTKEEDEFIEAARGRKVNWKMVADDHPKWNIFYMKQKLGVND